LALISLLVVDQIHELDDHLVLVLPQCVLALDDPLLLFLPQCVLALNAPLLPFLPQFVLALDDPHLYIQHKLPGDLIDELM
ncbi:hypothetical protein, partial [Pseudoalteromonas shioyasakiensis]|uniref:hypothetical protein n=1 Tax=Pseudoalteromonas shioyasakiensis TaxID=1190813 RepID=UPI0022B082C5